MRAVSAARNRSLLDIGGISGVSIFTCDGSFTVTTMIPPSMSRWNPWGVTIVGTLNLPSTMPLHASQMYARNITNLLALIIKDGRLELDFEDEIIADACITHNGKIVSKLLTGAPA